MALISSEASALVTATMEFSSWWLEDDDDHEADIRLRMATDDVPFRTPLAQGVFIPKPAPGLPVRKVVVTRAVLGDEGTLTFGVTNEDGLTAWKRLLGRTKTLLLQAPMTGRQWWVQIVGEPSESLSTMDYEDEPLRTITADVIEVEAP